MELVPTFYMLLVAFLIPLWVYWHFNTKYKRIIDAMSKLQGPRFPLIRGFIIIVTSKRHGIFRAIDELVKKYGPIYTTWVDLFTPEVHMLDAEHIEAVLRSTVNIEKSFFYNFLHPWLGRGLLTSAGQKWHSHRKLITPTFHFTILETFQHVFAEKGQILVEKLQKEVGNTIGFDVQPYITRCTLDIICDTAMGTDIRAQEDVHSSYVSAIHDVSEITFARLLRPWLYPDYLFYLTKDGKRFKECLHILHSFTEKVIRERKQNLSGKLKSDEEPDVFGRKRRTAFLDLLLEASEGGAVLSDEEIREEVDTFMFEGHDTTSSSLCWALFLLGNHPDVQQRVFEEQNAIFHESDRLPNIQDLSEMKYLEQVIKETLRLYPSVPFISRDVKEDIQVGEYEIPAGCQTTIHIYHLHRNPKYFPEPSKFDPDNFLPERVQRRHPYAYIPFSAGSRNCIGQKFALLEEKTLLSAVLRRFRVKALDRPEDVALMGELILRPQGGIRLAVERR